MRILMLINAFERDGPGNLVYALVSAMRMEPSVKIHVAALARGGPMEEDYRRLQTPISNFEMSSWFDWKVVVRLKDWFREQRFHVVHTHLLRPDLIGRVAARLCGVPCLVSTEHGLHAWSEKGRLIEPFVATLYRQTAEHCVDRIVAISEAVRRDLIESRIPGDKITVIQNGIDVSVFVPLSESRRRALRSLLCEDCDARRFVGFVGNFIERKGAVYFLDALPAVLARRPDVFPLLVGEGEQEEALRLRARQLGIAGRVAFVGKLARKLPELLASLDVLVVPSLDEPFGLIAAEAMACQTPVIAFNVGGLAEVVADGETGYLAPARSADGLADALLRLLEDDERRRAMGLAARERVKAQFNIELTARRYLELYRNILAAKGISPDDLDGDAPGNCETNAQVQNLK